MRLKIYVKNQGTVSIQKCFLESVYRDSSYIRRSHDHTREHGLSIETCPDYQWVCTNANLNVDILAPVRALRQTITHVLIIQPTLFHSTNTPSRRRLLFTLSLIAFTIQTCVPAPCAKRHKISTFYTFYPIADISWKFTSLLRSSALARFSEAVAVADTLD